MDLKNIVTSSGREVELYPNLMIKDLHSLKIAKHAHGCSSNCVVLKNVFHKPIQCVMLAFFPLDLSDFESNPQEINISGIETGVLIQVIDDDVNEADQSFVVMLELVSAIHPELITVQADRMFALIRIVDDDRKLILL